MKFFSFDQLDSTSTHSQRLLDDMGEMPPFAVWSRTQSQGRGRLGRSWLSPEGGLYLTIVLGETHLSSTVRAQLPIAVAVAVSRWVRSVFGVRPTIKWPNDLLFGAAKLCGILCEGRVQGHEWGPALIGVGINVHGKAPFVDDQATISLEEIKGEKIVSDLEIMARQLTDWLLVELAREFSPEAFEEYSLEQGQVWVDELGRMAYLRPLNSRGNLVLREFGSELDTEVQTVHHSWNWLYQSQDRPRPLLVADLGNSRCKVGIYRDALNPNEEPEILALNLRADENEIRKSLSAFFEPLALPKGWPVHVISVQDQDHQILSRLTSALGLSFYQVPKRSLKVDFSRYRVDQLGIDRMALVEAGHALFPGKNLILLSAGTAVTIEVLSAEGVYWGGYILAGLQTRLDALFEKTAKLPLLKLEKQGAIVSLYQDSLLGEDTVSAMLRGVLREVEWCLAGLKQDLARIDSSREWQVCLSGGSGELLGRILDVPCQPSLILKGVRLLVLGGLKSEGFMPVKT